MFLPWFQVTSAQLLSTSKKLAHTESRLVYIRDQRTTRAIFRLHSRPLRHRWILKYPCLGHSIPHSSWVAIGGTPTYRQLRLEESLVLFEVCYLRGDMRTRSSPSIDESFSTETYSAALIPVTRKTAVAGECREEQ